MRLGRITNVMSDELMSQIMEMVRSLTEEEQREVLDFIERLEKLETPDDSSDEDATN